MRSSTVIVALVCFALLAGTSRADEIQYHKTFAEAVKAAEEGHLLVMVVLVAPGKDPQGREVCKLLREEVLPSEPIAKLIREHFAPYLLDLTEVQAKRQALPDPVKAAFKPNEPISVPMALFFDPKFALVDKIAGYAPAENYIQLVRKAAEKAKGQVPASARQEVKQALERGKAALDQDDYNAAFDALNAALGGGVPGEDREAALRLAEQIQAKADEKLDAAKALEAQGKLGSAIRAYRDCARRFKGTRSAKDAAERLVELRKDPAIRKRLTDHVAAKLLADAQAAASESRYGAALDAIEALVERYGATEQAAEAKKLRDKLNADPDAARKVREDRARDEAERTLNIADGLRRNQMPEKALAEYKKVAEKFPDTSFARTAQQRIADLTRELGQR